MSLIILTLMTVCNKTFYVEFTFLLHKDCEYYDWLISHIKVVWVDVGCLNSPKTAVTDKDEALIEALEEGLSSIKLLLCQWHINKNVLTQVKTEAYFSNVKTQQIWTQLFFAVQNASTVADFHEAFVNLSLTDSDTDLNPHWSTTLYDYLLKEWFMKSMWKKHCCT